ncbi:PIN domain-containing protein [Nostoc sp. UIC 10630]|uniref:PIN domain-containing protein n=1 Tax=Nostoc sp. UIC 10630 TaxID=2100146 RepID=UPI0013CF51C5|nr:PIN domain-containing protein [Nostoc sp. UIC 10630]NEU80685.1 DUF4935 domain-containing protein [Nostoc sp. UIC 10630]
MNFVFIDTNTWIYLGEELNSIEYFDNLHEIFQYPDFKLVVPESTQIEFERHRNRVTENLTKKFKSHAINGYQVFKKFLPEKLEEIEKIHSDTQALIKKIPERVETNLNLIDELFEKAEIASIEGYMSEACRRCLHHIAPAHKNSRSSPGDCIFWLTALAYLDKGEVWFCTADNKDFSSQKNNELDEQLQQESKAKPFKIEYFNDLNALIQAALPYKPKLPELTPFIPYYLACSRCGSSNLFKLTRTIPGSWIDILNCQDCGKQIITNIEYMD